MALYLCQTFFIKFELANILYNRYSARLVQFDETFGSSKNRIVAKVVRARGQGKTS